MSDDTSDRSRAVALALSVLLGLLGVHRFYVGKTGTGILMLLTFGGFFVWNLIDIIQIAAGTFTDVEGRRVLHWSDYDSERSLGSGSVPQELLDELDTLRADVNELHERVDFTERLLTRARRSGDVEVHGKTPV